MWVGVLGSLTVREGDRQLQVPAGIQRTVLAALALRANQAVTPQELADVVWDASPPASVDATLRNYIKHLRHTLGSDRLVTARPGYLIRLGEQELDVTRFEGLVRQADIARYDDRWLDVRTALSQALDLWRGSPLADIRSERLRREHGPRLEQLRLQALEVRVEADLYLGRHEHVVPEQRLWTATGRRATCWSRSSGSNRARSSNACTTACCPAIPRCPRRRRTATPNRGPSPYARRPRYPANCRRRSATSSDDAPNSTRSPPSWTGRRSRPWPAGRW
jgi:hypothetical protein